jgi:hypothetical protein
MCGDLNNDTLQRFGCGEGWFSVLVEECDSNPLIANDLEFRAQLISNPGGEYRLDMFSPCGNQFGGTIGTDQVYATIPDNLGQDDSRVIYIRVYPYTGSSVENWSLQFEGNWQ